MKVHEWYSSKFNEYGDIKLVKHPYHQTKITYLGDCVFNEICVSTKDCLLAMSSRKGDAFISICEHCVRYYFTSWNQGHQSDILDYVLFADGVDLNKEIT